VSLVKRLGGVFFAPRRTFKELASQPAWLDTLVVLMLALVAFNLIVSPYVKDQNLQLLRGSAVLRAALGEVTFAKIIENTEHPSRGTWILQIVLTALYFLAVLLLQSLLLLIMGRSITTQGTYGQVFSALVHADLIDKLLGNAVRLVLVLSRRSLMQTSTGLALFLPNMEVTSIPYIMLSQIDIFQIWMFGVLAFGLAAAFRIGLRKALALSCAMWLLKALFNISMGLISVDFLR
jgi:hypothetical protein